MRIASRVGGGAAAAARRRARQRRRQRRRGGGGGGGSGGGSHGGGEASASSPALAPKGRPRSRCASVAAMRSRPLCAEPAKQPPPPAAQQREQARRGAARGEEGVGWGRGGKEGLRTAPRARRPRVRGVAASGAGAQGSFFKFKHSARGHPHEPRPLACDTGVGRRRCGRYASLHPTPHPRARARTAHKRRRARAGGGTKAGPRRNSRRLRGRGVSSRPPRRTRLEPAGELEELGGAWRWRRCGRAVTPAPGRALA